MRKFGPHLVAGLLILAFVLSVGGSALAAYAPISLNVPSYKQTDERRASVRIGNSGKTIGKIGCAITSLAMAESYRTGTRIEPDQMESRLSFNAGGALFWPANYSIPGSITFEQLYQKLKNGIPVIVGAINANGGTHFAIVKGYDGGDTLSASGFLINDPGSSSRTRLSQFMAAYPTLYRRVYYTD